MAEVKLTQGKVMIVDDQDLEMVLEYKWHAHKEGIGLWYAQRNSTRNGKRVKIRLHRLIMGLSADDSITVDHINGDTLDNRRCNLRLATLSENRRNSRKKRASASRYKGIYFDKQKNRWTAAISINGVNKRSKRFKSEEDAAREYDRLALEHFGEFARLNFGRG